MEWIFWSAMAVMVAALYALALTGKFGMRVRVRIPGAPVFERVPRVAVIVPMSGCDPLMEACLDSVLSQDYPDYEVLFVTQTADEDAAVLARRVLAGRPAGSFPACRHIAAGSAATCGQKNHNLLAGIDAASGDREVFVFLDAARTAPPYWLKSLVEPIARGEAAVTTGYHHVLPGNYGIAATGRAVVVRFLDLIQRTGWFTQPWGGNMAISRKAFEEFQVRTTWEGNVVDDVSLDVVLRRHGHKAKLVREAQLLTSVTDESIGDWCRWLTRQILYLKFCQPGSWVLAGILVHLAALLLLAAVFRIAAGLMGVFPEGTAIPDFLLLALLLGTARATMACHPRPGPPIRWLAASLATLFIGNVCVLRTYFTDEILWRGIRYKVSGGGRVVEIRDERPARSS